MISRLVTYFFRSGRGAQQSMGRAAPSSEDEREAVMSNWRAIRLVYEARKRGYTITSKRVQQRYRYKKQWHEKMRRVYCVKIRGGGTLCGFKTYSKLCDFLEVLLYDNK